MNIDKKYKCRLYSFSFIMIFILSFLLNNIIFFNSSALLNTVNASVKTVYAKKKAKKTVKKVQQKIAYLTFDDGPSENTDKVLNILDKYKIKATFFVVGLNQDKAAVKRLKEIVKRGHSLGIHSLTHNYKQIYASLDAFKKDVYAIRDFVKKSTGIDAKIYRFPGGSSNGVSKTNMYTIIEWLESAGFKYFDWNLGGTDAAWPAPSADKIYNDIAMYSKSNSDKIVLIHDSKGKENSVKALPKIIEKLKKEGYKFDKITEDTKPVHHNVNKKYKKIK
ncbi:MAG: polysaccharide deacetylase family protein [Catonella sp.]|uniref:polysaccharide deacetylase family protein n=1 Tax=Catonella sp. TaxID=2382125 RepID=UPI003F9F78B2